MKQNEIEPGLLSTFRFFAVLLWVFFLIEAARLVHIAREAPLTSYDYEYSLFFTAFVLAQAFLLAVYLWWPRVQLLFGNWFLVIGLVMVTTSSIIVQHMEFAANLRYKSWDEGSSTQGWETALILLIPLVLIAWQFRFRAVVRFSLATALMDWGLKRLLLQPGNPHLQYYEDSIALRTVLYLVIGYLIFQLMIAQRKQRQDLAQTNRRLSDYATTLEQLTVTRERNRMARELHDILAHTLSGLAVQLEAVRSLWQSAPEKAYAMLEDSLSVTREGLTETRKAIQSLRASPLEDLGLPLAIRTLAENAASRAGTTLDLDIPKNPVSLSPDVEQCIFRVAQESLENIVRHAEARHINVRLACEGNRLALIVADDGQGFEIERLDAQQHFGLRGMIERVQMIGGKLEIQSRLNHGTTVHLEFEQES